MTGKFMWLQHLQCVTLHDDLYLCKQQHGIFYQPNSSVDQILKKSTFLARFRYCLCTRWSLVLPVFVR